MKKKERRPAEQSGGNEWLNAMCEVLKGGVLAGVVTILALLLCAVLVSIGAALVEAIYGMVLFLLLITAGLIVYEGASIANGGAGILCACLCGGAIPGLLARKPKKKRRR